jgi:cysteine desulfurase
MMSRIYLDYNATMPLRMEARAAMIAAMDVVGNPSSAHKEGRAARAILEKAREDIMDGMGAVGADLIFTSGATEAASLALSQGTFYCAEIEHDAVVERCEACLPVDWNGTVGVLNPSQSTLQLANGETGVMQDLPDGLWFSDMTQALGKTPLAFNWLPAQTAAVSAHKLGGPKGVGALVVKRGTDIAAQIKGGGQEMGRRSGTENVIAIAGFAAAVKAAQKDLSNGIWDEVAELRDYLEKAIVQSTENTICIGQAVERLPNTSCLVSSGWKGDIQVMQMDLNGIAVSAGSACSSGKVKASRVLMAMGLEAENAACGLRVSLGSQTTKLDVERFIECWTAKKQKMELRRAS